jgi:Na+-translocating ferredoxin:NAD+ oxidoreductase RnfG subunit
LNKYWQDNEFTLVRKKLDSDQPEIYTVNRGTSAPFAYILFDEAPSKVDTFIYMVIFKPDGSIEKVSVLLYKENYGGEIASTRFLKQFNGKSNGSGMEFNKDIDGISGATLSVRSITRAININSKSFSKLISEPQ